MSNLIPEKRMNKHGVMVTKHVKPAITMPSSHEIPPPVVKKTESKNKFKPSARQKEKRDLSMYLPYDECDAELTDKLAEDGNHYGKTFRTGFRFEASETEFYDVHSVASLGNAATMLASGVRSKEEALELLSGIHLDRIVEDNSLMTQAMLENRVSFESFLEFDKVCGFEKDTDPQLYADAASIHSVKGYHTLTSDLGRSIYDEVLDGRLSASDLKTIGLNRLQNAMSSDPVFKALAAINNGEAAYDAPQLAVFLDRASNEVGYTVAIQMADAYGIEYVSGLNSIWKAQSIQDSMKDADVETRREAINYADEIEQLTDISKPYSLSTNDVLKLYQEGVAPEVAVEHTEAGLTPEQIIAIHKEGIASSIASGFL
jgi:hypothetical protein